MPDWIIRALTQFPIVVVIGLVAWYSYGQIKQAHTIAQNREEEIHKARIADMQQFHQQMLAEKNAEIARLRDEIKDETRELGRRIDALIRKIS